MTDKNTAHTELYKEERQLKEQIQALTELINEKKAARQQKLETLGKMWFVEHIRSEANQLSKSPSQYSKKIASILHDLTRDPKAEDYCKNLIKESNDIGSRTSYLSLVASDEELKIKWGCSGITIELARGSSVSRKKNFHQLVGLHKPEHDLPLAVQFYFDKYGELSEFQTLHINSIVGSMAYSNLSKEATEAKQALVKELKSLINNISGTDFTTLIQ